VPKLISSLNQISMPNTNNNNKFTVEQPEWGIRLSKYCFIPQRIILSVMGLLSVANAYAMRYTTSMVFSVLVLRKNITEEVGDEEYCPKSHTDTIQPSSGTYEWSDQLQSIIVGSFYVGYLMTHIPGGIYADRFGGKWILAYGVLVSSVLTCLTPFAIKRAGSTALIMIRGLTGLSQGVIYPCLTSLIACWVPPMERGTLTTIAFSGSAFGYTIISGVSRTMLSRFDWPMLFYLFGVSGGVWFLFFIIFCFESPEFHPYIKPKEKEYIEKELGPPLHHKPLIPWRSILTSSAVYAELGIQLGINWTFCVIMNDMPKYMADILNFSIAQMESYTTFPYVGMWLTAVFAGFLSDFLVSRNIMEVTRVRRMTNIIASFGPGFFMLGSAYAGCNHTAVGTMFIISSALLGFLNVSTTVTPIEMSPNYAGTLAGLLNGMGSFTSVVASYIVSLMTPNSTLLEWRAVFYVTSVLVFSTCILYLAYSSNKEQPFNYIDPNWRIC